MSERAVTIQEVRGHEFKVNGVLAFTLVGSLIVGKSRAGGVKRTYAVEAIDVVLKYLEGAPAHEVERARKVIEKRR